MPKIGIYLLMTLLLALQVRYTVVQIDYSMHRDYIAKVLCVEKDIPQSTCNGKCHLKKELKKLDQRDGEKGDAPIQMPISNLDYILDAHETDLDSPESLEQSMTSVWYDAVLSKGAHTVDSPPPEWVVLV